MALLGRCPQVDNPVYVIINDKYGPFIKGFFADNGHFGIDDDSISFLTQASTLVLDKNGKGLLKTKEEPWIVPCGNGEIFSLMQTGLGNDLLNRQIKYAYIMGTTNMLGQPLDPTMVGAALEQVSQGVCKVPRDAPLGEGATQRGHPLSQLVGS